jgi:hypothetical protein
LRDRGYAPKYILSNSGKPPFVKYFTTIGERVKNVKTEAFQKLQFWEKLDKRGFSDFPGI